MGMFGSAMVADLLRKVPIAGGTPPIYGGKYGEYEGVPGIQGSAPDVAGVAASASPITKRSGFFGNGTPGRAALGGLLDSILTMTGGQAINTPYLLAQKQHSVALEDEQRKRSQALEDAIALAKAKAQYQEPHYWETNDGSLAAIGPDGKPQVLYKDPTPKINWVRADNGDGTFTMVPVPMGGLPQQPTPAPTQPNNHIPLGGPLRGASNSKVIGSKQYWNINGKWYDNPEGR